MERLLYSVREVAELLGVSRSFAYELVANGTLPAVRIGSTLRVPADGLAEWLHEAQESRLVEPTEV